MQQMTTTDLHTEVSMCLLTTSKSERAKLGIHRKLLQMHWTACFDSQSARKCKCDTPLPLHTQCGLLVNMLTPWLHMDACYHN